MTQVWTAVKYLKDKSPAIVPFDDVISYLSLPTDAAKNIPLIRRALRESDRATYISKAESGNGKESFKYRPLYPVTDAEELKDCLATLGQESAQGIPVKDLKDGWPDCTAHLDRLETEGFVLITRWKKDSTARTIYPDSPSYHILNPTSGLPQKVDADFVDVWSKTKLPGSEMEIRNELEKAGLTPTSQVREVRRTEGKKKEKRRVHRKGGKTTNAHMLGILKDYSRR
jgi:transcription initiation factor TFIIE subunit beta